MVSTVMLDSSGCTPLHYACDRSMFTVVQLFATTPNFKKLCSIRDINGRTPLHVSVGRKDSKSVELITAEFPDSLQLSDRFVCL